MNLSMWLILAALVAVCAVGILWCRADKQFFEDQYQDMIEAEKERLKELDNGH